MSLYTLSRKTDLPANYHCTSSTLTYFIQFYTILPNLADQMMHLGVPVNNIDPEPYPRDSVLDCLGICLSMFVFKPLIRQVWETMPFSKSGNRKRICLDCLFSF